VTVRVGLGLFTGQVPQGSDRTFVQEYADIIELSRLAESEGFDSVWVSEHHGAGDGYLPSLLPMLAAVAAATERIGVGTGVMLTPFHHPLRLAEDAAVVDLISGGRLMLGLGLGWREEEFRMFDVPVKERVRRTNETVEILRKAWTGERFSHDGKVFSIDQVRITPAPAQRPGPPIYLGGFVEDAVRRAGRMGDGYIRSRGGLEDAVQAAAWAEEGAREAGKDPSKLAILQLQNTFVSEGNDAWSIVRDGAAHQLGVYAGWRAGTDIPVEPVLRVMPPSDEELRALTPAGTPEEVAAALRPTVDAFAERESFQLIVRLHYPGMDRDTAAQAIELFARTVIPALTR
jgi:probable F420-dependent oxidoreductase